MRENGLYILFDQPQRGITSGQFATWYDPIKESGDNQEVALAVLHPDTNVEMIGSGVI
jgi:hypothetical protein